MNLSSFYRVSAAVLVVMVVTSVWGLAQVGLDAKVPVHWGPSGEVDGYASAWVAFLLTPLIAVGVVALLAAIPRFEPRRENLRRSSAAYRTVANAIVLLLLVIQIGVVAAGVGGSFPMATVMGTGIGILFVVIGNVLGTVRSNFLFGVRTPWTLSSDLAWDRTHRLVGRLFVITGIVLVVLSLAGQLALVIGAMLAGIIVILIVAVWYSYAVWKQDPDHRPTGTSEHTA
jgi:uncharacterized membrane protein